MKKKIILASKSPRRKELLKTVGLKFKVKNSEFSESSINAASPSEHAEILSKSKAKQAALKYKNALIIAADTIVDLEGEIIGKPKGEDNAKEILRKLSGKTHSVITSFTITDAVFNKSSTRSVESKVTLKSLTDEEIEAYVKTKEPLDKAGAYGIQGKGGVFIESVEGDYFNVVGLPIFALCEELRRFGIDIIKSWK